jgi:hypothetical protein
VKLGGHFVPTNPIQAPHEEVNLEEMRGKIRRLIESRAEEMANERANQR